MKEKPILFSTAMVQAIQRDMKSQTRRVVKCPASTTEIKWVENHNMAPNGTYTGWAIRCDAPLLLPTKGKRGAGDVLWVKETHFQWGKWVKDGFTPTGKQRWRFVCKDKTKLAYMDSPPETILTKKSHTIGWYKRPSIFMPRWAARIFLTVKAARFERLQDISARDCVSEGIELDHWKSEDYPLIDHGIEREAKELRRKFKILWDSINAKRSPWVANNWVEVTTFERKTNA